MAATTPHPTPLPPPAEDEHGIYEPEPGWMDKASDNQLWGCVAVVLIGVFIAGFICGAVLT